MSFLSKFLLLAASVLGLGLSAEAQVKAGDPFPPLALAQSAAPNSARLPETEGKVVLVDFWASWCAPCKASFPAYARLHADYAARGLLIVAVSVDDDAAAYASFAKKLAPPFWVLRDETKKLVRMVKVPAMPTSYLVGRDGKVRFMHVGFHSEDTERSLRSEIESLLGEKG